MQVDECLASRVKNTNPTVSQTTDILQRCVVCTLPHGTCKHDQQWFVSRDCESILDPLPKDSVELTMDDISDVLTPVSTQTARVTTEPGAGASSLPHLRWETLSPQPASKLSDCEIDLSTSCPRAGHTMVLLDGPGSYTEDTRLLVVFGGVTSTEHEEIHGIKATPECRGRLPRQTLSYNSDIWVFRLGRRTWHCPDVKGELPRGRYGHVSLALGSEMMWMFGGRMDGGSQAGDTFVFNTAKMHWERLNVGGGAGPTPSPRVWSAAAKVGERIFLFGGADLERGQNFDDLWAWSNDTRHWEEQIVVGTPPLSRYGHALLACPNGQVLIFGGCCVSTSAEEALPTDHKQLKSRVRVAADRVIQAYQFEDAELGGSMPTLNHIRGGNLRKSHPRSNDNGTAWQTLKFHSRKQAQHAAAVAAREKETDLREEQLRAVLNEQAAMAYWAKLHSQHPLKHIDVTFLDTENMMWGATNPQPSRRGRSTLPIARMHFSAIVIDQKVVLWGGCFPTSRRLELSDEGVYVFDLVNRRWNRAAGQHQQEGIKPLVDAAFGQLRRAERALYEAKQRAMALGAPRGRTLQVRGLTLFGANTALFGDALVGYAGLSRVAPPGSNHIYIFNPGHKMSFSHSILRGNGTTYPILSGRQVVF